MKPLFKIVICLFAALYITAACKDSDDEGISGFTIDTQEITLAAEGGTEIVNVASGTKWVAKVSEPWVKVIPANGIGTTECQVVIDTTLANKVRNAIVTFVPEGQERHQLEIHQTGYGKMIGLSEENVKVANMAIADKRFFEVSVTTNVRFDVNYDRSSWVTTIKKTPDISFDNGARPRTIKMRFNWEMNPNAEERTVEIRFTPKDPEAAEVVMTVTQEAAPEITPDRRGDSIALVIASAKMRSMVNWDTSERLEYWQGVTVWEKTDEGVTEEMIGRVRSAEFRMLNTKEGLPLEIGKITYLESLVIFGNTNIMLLPSDFKIGNALANLEHLKRLTIGGYGITTISKSELAKPSQTLEYLDLESNSFERIPYDLTPANYPKLESLSLNGMRRYTIKDLNNESREHIGLKLRADDYSLKNLFKWEKLKALSLSYNLIYGKLPNFLNTNGTPEYGVSVYTDADIQKNDTLSSASEEVKAKLKTVPKILPNVEYLSLNLNFLSGDDLPDWLLYHPRFARFDPFTLIYTQESGLDMDGNVPGFKNEPANLEWFYERYPKARPTIID